MHSSSNLTCSASTSSTLRARFMTGSGRRAASPGQPTAQTVHIPQTGTPVTGLPLDRNPPTQPAPQHDSSGRGDAPLEILATGGPSLPGEPARLGAARTGAVRHRGTVH